MAIVHRSVSCELAAKTAVGTLLAFPTPHPDQDLMLQKDGRTFTLAEATGALFKKLDRAGPIGFEETLPCCHKRVRFEHDEHATTQIH